MKMFPHAFFPFFPLHRDSDASQASAEGTLAEVPAKQARAISTRPVKIDVEKAVNVLLATSVVRDDNARQRFRLDVIKAVPAQSIDWDRVDWVQMWPFQSVRR